MEIVSVIQGLKLLPNNLQKVNLNISYNNLGKIG